MIKPAGGDKVFHFVGNSSDWDKSSFTLWNECIIANGSIFTEIDTSKVYKYDEEGQSWIEQVAQGGGGGEGGTTNYLELANKPSINGIELKGNLTSEDLGLDKVVVDDVNESTIAEYGFSSPILQNKNDGSIWAPGYTDSEGIVRYCRLVFVGEEKHTSVTESEINGNVLVNDQEVVVYRLPKDFEDYLIKVTYKQPVINAIRLCNGTTTLPLTNEYGDSLTATALKHSETNIHNISGQLEMNGEVFDPSETSTIDELSEPIVIDSKKSFYLKGKNTLGEAISSAAATYTFNTYMYYNTHYAEEADPTTGTKSSITETNFKSSGFEFEYTINTDLCIFMTEGNLKVQTNVLGAWADVDYTVSESAGELTQANGVVRNCYCYRVHFSTGSGKAIYRVTAKEN